MNLIADMLNTTPKQATESGAGDNPIQISLDKIIPSKNNIYGIRGIDDLADDIEMNGLYHNLVCVCQMKNPAFVNEAYSIGSTFF